MVPSAKPAPSSTPVLDRYFYANQYGNDQNWKAQQRRHGHRNLETDLKAR